MQAADTYWTHDLSPVFVPFPDNPLGLQGIHYYGLSYLLAFVCAWLLIRLYHQREKIRLNGDARASLMTAVILGVLIGGRMGYMLLYDLSAFLSNPLLVLKINQGGMASHGGFAGVTLALLWFARKHQYPLLRLGDIICTVAPLGLMFGRIANFINGELWGKVSTVPWAVYFPNSPQVYDPGRLNFVLEPRHPSQLYQAALEGALLFLYAQWRFWKGSPHPGQIAGEFLIGYGSLRIVGEVFREPDASLILGISRGQFYSVFLLLAGFFVLLLAKRAQRKQKTGT